MKQWITLQQITEDDKELKLYETMLELSQEYGVDINALVLTDAYDYPEIGYWGEASEEYTKFVRDFRQRDIAIAKKFIEMVSQGQYTSNGFSYGVQVDCCYYGGYTQPPTIKEGEELLRAAIEDYNEAFPEDPYKE